MKHMLIIVLVFPLWTTAQTLIDSLNYTYNSGNQLLKVEDYADDLYGFKDDAVAVADTVNDYSYDGNGNLISDANKGITHITYNHLNLPVLITFVAPPGGTRSIAYVYDANGVKQERKGYRCNHHGNGAFGHHNHHAVRREFCL